MTDSMSKKELQYRNIHRVHHMNIKRSSFFSGKFDTHQICICIHMSRESEPRQYMLSEQTYFFKFPVHTKD